MWATEWDLLSYNGTVDFTVTFFTLGCKKLKETTQYIKQKKERRAKETALQLGPALSTETACLSKWSTAGPGSVFHIQHLARGLLRGLWISACVISLKEIHSQQRCRIYCPSSLPFSFTFFSPLVLNSPFNVHLTLHFYLFLSGRFCQHKHKPTSLKLLSVSPRVTCLIKLGDSDRTAIIKWSWLWPWTNTWSTPTSLFSTIKSQHFQQMSLRRVNVEKGRGRGTRVHTVCPTTKATDYAQNRCRDVLRPSPSVW